MYALVDADPHGIDILSVYTYGSSKNAFSEDYAGLPLGGRLQWIGVKATELSR
jgi:meiotic recombination protein SPO11